MSLVRAIELVVLVGALVGALATIWHKMGFATMKKRTGQFLDDWTGEDARPGFEARPSFPERMAAVEKRTAGLNHDMRNELGGRLALVEELLSAMDERTKQLTRNGGSSMADQVHAISNALKRVEEAVLVNRGALEAANQRVSDHRNRNDQQIEELRRYLEEERRDLLVAKQALEASVSELLMVRGRALRDGGDCDDPDGNC